MPTFGTDWEKVGTVYVDSGQIAVGDPCYTQDPEALIQRGVHNWSHWLHLTYPETFSADGEIIPNGPSLNVANVLGDKGTGIVVSSGYGDGEYNVFVRKNYEGRIMGVMVDFEDAGWEDEDENDECAYCGSTWHTSEECEGEDE